MDGDRNENWWTLDREFQSEAGRLSMWLLTPSPSWRRRRKQLTSTSIHDSHHDMRISLVDSCETSCHILRLSPSCLTLSLKQKRNYTRRMIDANPKSKGNHSWLSGLISFLPDRLMWEEYNKKERLVMNHFRLDVLYQSIDLLQFNEE